MPREFKHYMLRSTKKPTKDKVLLSTVAIRDQEGEERYCYVSFSDKLVELVGRKLPRGISETDPAFLNIVFGPPGRWGIWAVYAVDGVARLLWRTECSEPPSWLKFYKLKVKNGHSKTDKTS